MIFLARFAGGDTKKKEGSLWQSQLATLALLLQQTLTERDSGPGGSASPHAAPPRGLPSYLHQIQPDASHRHGYPNGPCSSTGHYFQAGWNGEKIEMEQ